jgi:hypothetical protein
VTVVVSQTWGEVHRVNERVRDGLKGKGLLGAADMVVKVLEKLDLTNAQKRDVRFYPPEATVVFNQKVRAAQPGAEGKLAGIVKAGVLIEVGGKFVTVPNKLLDRITLCQTREVNLATGETQNMNTNENLLTAGCPAVAPQPINQLVKPVKFPALPQEWKIVSLRECPTPDTMQRKPFWEHTDIRQTHYTALNRRPVCRTVQNQYWEFETSHEPKLNLFPLKF